MYQASVYSLCIDDVTFWLQAMMRFFFRCILTGSPQSLLIPRAIDRIFLGYEDDESNSESLSLSFFLVMTKSCVIIIHYSSSLHVAASTQREKMKIHQSRSEFDCAKENIPDEL